MNSAVTWMALVFMALTQSVTAGEAHIAVAANFAGSMKNLASQFERASAHRLLLSMGSTGKFYAQVRNAAPFDVLLSADDETPARMEQEGLAVPATRFTYAIGKLVLWSPAPGMVDPAGEVLKSSRFTRIAIANPRLAPYGAAARSVMEKMGIWPALQERIVLGENIAQAFQFVSSGNAELGFVAWSQVKQGRKAPAGSYWLVPQANYDPIRQDAVLLKRASTNAAAREFLDFLRSAPARELIRADGYDLP